MRRHRRARWGGIGRMREVLPRPAPRKEAAPCCIARALPDGRPVIGFCGPLCIRRPSIWAQQEELWR